MTEKSTRTQVTCCVCQDYREKGVFNKWYTPTPNERRVYHFKKVKLSHSYCPTCYILHMREDGFPDSEIERMVKDAEAIK